MINLWAIIRSGGRLTILLVASSTSSFISCPSGNTPSIAQQQPFFTNAPGSPVTVQAGPGNVLMADMNNDRKLDLIVTLGPARSITILEGKGNGQFGAALSTTTLTDPPGDMSVGDLNSDGKLDVAITSHDSYGVVLLTGDGKGGLVKAANSPVVMKPDGQHPHTHGLAVADMNRDNKLDLITCNNADNDISIALGDGRGNFGQVRSFPVGPSPYPFGVGDVNNDGWPDIAATASATGPSRREQLPLSRALTLLLSDGKGGFSPRQLPIRTGEPWFAAIADLNRDGRPDIVATHHEINALTVMIGDGRGGFTEAPGSPFDFGTHFLQVIIADVDGDSTMDVVGTTGNSIRVLLGDGRGSFKQTASIPVGPGAWRFAGADLNGDGATDVATSNSEGNTVNVLLARAKNHL